MIVLVSWCLMVLQTACTSERKVYVNRPIPESLLTDCLPNIPSKMMTFGDSVNYNEHLLNVIEKCNEDKHAIKKIINRQ
ncbi:peptidase [Frischella sp. Ac13]|uniref:Peptidase n=2 Tax=Frischella japonica TaxID=2741544 RepID=A0ABR7QYN9_9GAMM|nr:peptidase [Frischella japonica]